MPVQITKGTKQWIELKIYRSLISWKKKKTSKSIKSETRFLVNSRTQVEVLPKKMAGNILELYICLQKWYEQVMSKYLSDTKVLLVITFTDLQNYCIPRSHCIS